MATLWVANTSCFLKPSRSMALERSPALNAPSSWISFDWAIRPSPTAICASFFFNDTATTEIYTLSLHDALPILLFHRLDQLIEGKAQASALFSGPYYFAEQLGFRKIIDTTFMIATMVTGDPDPEDLRKFFRALKRAQRDIDLRPDLYTHYYKSEFPTRYHAMMDTRRWGPGERLVFEPYTKEVYEETFKWIADHGIFADSGMGTGNYEEAVIRAQ